MKHPNLIQSIVSLALSTAAVQGTVLCLIPDARCEFANYNELLASCKFTTDY